LDKEQPKAGAMKKMYMILRQSVSNDQLVSLLEGFYQEEGVTAQSVFNELL